MKKTLVVMVLLLGFALPAHAQVVDNTALIAKLLAQVEALRAQLALMTESAEKPREDGVVMEVADVLAGGFDTYGSYQLELDVTASHEEDLLIPYSTNASAVGRTGFTYKINGSDFKGTQSDRISCPTKTTIKAGNFSKKQYCKIRAGKTVPISVNVFLTPYSGESGNFSVDFTKVTYWSEEEQDFVDYDLDDAETNAVYVW